MLPFLSVRSLRKIYPGKVPFTAVNDVSFDLLPAQILGLLGANGAGKTTTIQMLLSTLKPSSGSILYFGKELMTYRSEVLQHVAFASTYVGLPGNLTVQQNLEVFGRFYGLSSREIRLRIMPLLERFGLGSKIKKAVSTLSAGQLTRLMLIKAFMTYPKVALLDEPTASLDPDIAKEVINFVFEQRKQQGTAVLYTSHNMGEIAEVCDRVLFMKEGKIVANDLPQNLARSVLPFRVTLQMADGMKRTVVIAEEMGLKYKVDHRSIVLELDEPHIAQFLSAIGGRGVLYTHIRIKEPDLEDYFLHMSGKRLT